MWPATKCKPLATISPAPALTNHRIYPFVIHHIMAESDLAHTMNKAYLSAIQSLHIQLGLVHIFLTQLTPCVEMVLQGIKKEQSENNLIL